MNRRRQICGVLLMAGLLTVVEAVGGSARRLYSYDDDQVEVVEVDTAEYDTTIVDSTIVIETITDVFKYVPDSLMPYLSLVNRLDFIDYMTSNMKAIVENKMGGTSEMTALTDDSLSIRMNDALRVDMLLLNLDEPVDGIHQVVVFIETFLTDFIYGESVQKVYSTDWQPVTMEISWNECQKKRLSALKLQNIFKRNEDILNNR